MVESPQRDRKRAGWGGLLFSHSVLKRHCTADSKSQGLFGKGLRVKNTIENVVENAANAMLSFINGKDIFLLFGHL